MSRSRKKTPICGITKAESAKRDKRIANRMFRRISKNSMRYYLDSENFSEYQSSHPHDCETHCIYNQYKFINLPMYVSEVYNVYNFATDGKRWNVYPNWERS